jgi:hypothetical protein
MSYISIVGGKIIETTGGDDTIYAKNITYSAQGTLSQTGVKGGVSYDKDPKKYKPKNAQIVKVEFLDENNKILKQETLAAFGNIQATNFIIGKPVKIKITTKDVADGTQIRFSLKGNSKSVNQQFFDIDKQKWNGTIKENFFETPLFEFNNMWFSEDLEIYNYKSHTTEITSENLNSFYINGVLNAKPFELPKKADRLKPITYLRNYEELIGLFHTNDTGVKDLVNNYENKFILGSQLENLSVGFSEFINHTKNITIAQIKTRVEQDAKLL